MTDHDPVPPPASPAEPAEEFHLSTADMLEIAASGGNGSEYVDIPGLMLRAAAELRTTPPASPAEPVPVAFPNMKGHGDLVAVPAGLLSANPAHWKMRCVDCGKEHQAALATPPAPAATDEEVARMVDGVMDLFPGADRQALQCLAALLTKPAPAVTDGALPPELVPHIQRMAATGSTGSLVEWNAFLDLLARVAGDRNTYAKTLARIEKEDDTRARAAEQRAEAAEKALALLVADVADYPAWQRPCHALDVARAHLAKHAGGGND